MSPSYEKDQSFSANAESIKNGVNRLLQRITREKTEYSEFIEIFIQGNKTKVELFFKQSE